MKKKVISMALCAAMVSALAGCGLKAPDEPTTAAQTTAAQTEGSGADRG